MPGKPIRQLLAAVAVFVLVGAGVAALLVFGGDDKATPPPPSPSRTPSSAPDPPPPRDPVLVVKIDSVRAARPHTGLAAADVVYVEPVEGGLTRIAAVYSAHLPGVAGPVRSARETDAELLAQYGRPTLAFSGAAPEIMPVLRKAPLRLVTERDRPRAYFRDRARPQPHNLFVRTERLPIGRGPGPRHAFDFGPAPSGGTPATDRTVRYRAASYRFQWSRGRWMVSMDGAPLRSAGAGQLGAATVVVQRVAIRQGRRVIDAAGSMSPVAKTVGTGPATILRGGKAYQARWSRPTARQGTTFTAASGEEVPLAPGRVWVLLVPR